MAQYQLLCLTVGWAHGRSALVRCFRVMAYPLIEDHLGNIGEHLPKGVVLAAAGTAGHIYPAVAIAEALRELGVGESDITFVTSQRKVENEIFSTLSFQRIDLAVHNLTSRGIIAPAVGVWRLLKGIIALRHRLFELQPGVVVVFGGYISVVAAIAARSLSIPIVVVETNSVMGKANRLASRIGDATIAAFGAGNNDSGVPLRTSVTSFVPTVADRADLVRSLGFVPEDVGELVTIFGGSLGSRTINDAAISMLETQAAQGVKSRRLYYLVVGRRDEDLYKVRLEVLRNTGELLLTYSGYDPELFKVVGCSDAVICRSGSNTVAELDYFGTPAILVPLPNSPGDHQVRNALWFQDRRLGVVVQDSQCTSATLDTELSTLLLATSSFEERAKEARGKTSRTTDVGVKIAKRLRSNYLH